MNQNQTDAQQPQPLSAAPATPCGGRGVVACLVILAVLCIDQALKVYVKTHFWLHESYEVTPWWQILFTENRGMAFGMDFIGTAPLAIFRVAAVAGFVYLLLRAIASRLPMSFIVCMAMIIAGAAGNIIDNLFYGLIFTESSEFAAPAELVAFGEGYGRMFEGRVVDMFYFPLFTWPDWVPLVGGRVFFNAIFNFADASIDCGAAAMLLFYHKTLGRVMGNGTKQETEEHEEQTVASSEA